MDYGAHKHQPNRKCAIRVQRDKDVAHVPSPLFSFSRAKRLIEAKHLARKIYRGTQLPVESGDEKSSLVAPHP